MQMQRWLGYRGSHLPFCRVFLYRHQFELYQSYHEGDLANRARILEHIDANVDEFQNDCGWWFDQRTGGPRGYAGQPAYNLTNKISEHKLPLDPTEAPFLRIMEPDSTELGLDNLALVEQLLGAGTWQRFDKAPRGLLRSEEMTAVEVAELLEGLRYSAYCPTGIGGFYRRWDSIRERLVAPEPFLRLPEGGADDGLLPDQLSEKCPYSIAAYLRLWDYLTTATADQHTFRVLGTSQMGRLKRWSQMPLPFRREKPVFRVGVQFGQAGSTTLGGREVQLVRRQVVQAIDGRETFLIPPGGGTWGGGQATAATAERSSRYFDYRGPVPPPKYGWHRPMQSTAGASWLAPGLLLLHVVATPGDTHSLAIGMAIPSGAPSHFDAIPPDRKRDDPP